MPMYANVPDTQGQIQVIKVGNAPEVPSLFPQLSGPFPAQEGCYSPTSWGWVGFRHMPLRMPSGSLGLSASPPLLSLGISRPSMAFSSLLLVFFLFNMTMPNLDPLWESEGM